MIRYYLTFLCVCKLVFASGETTLFRQRRGTGLSTLSTNPQPHQTSIEHIDAVLVHRLWPPWPFNTLESTDSNQKRKKTLTLPIIKTRTFLLWAYLRERAKIGTLQLQQVAHDFSYHLPSTAPPVFLLALLPNQKTILEMTAVPSSIRLMAWDVAKKAALLNLGIVFTCWTDFEIRRRMRLGPLHLQSYSSRFHEAILPPFLPAEIETPTHPMAINEEKRHPNHILSRTLDNIWIRTRKFLRKDPVIAEEQRQLIIHELLALQKLKSYHHGISNNKPQYSSSERGYALVTGASRGIGRALAVELARWGIPLILVARSGDKLSTLAHEIESCYGVRCHALTADLSDPTAAFMVYNTTKSAGLHVDILVNNAGICTRGELVESSTTDISRLLQLNIASVTTLSQLYGKDMKKQRKGRILFVSSIAAGAPSTPEVAAYAASKAYEKSLSMALSMELAKYGVGVTCLMPGAVKGTSFASSSRIDDALCWKVPGYAMSAPKVASVGIRALLNGAVEVAPGWHNFSFLKFIVPTLPPRVSSTIASMAFRPIFAEPKSNHDSHDENYGTEDILSSPYSAPQTESMMEPVLLDNNEDKPIS